MAGKTGRKAPAPQPAAEVVQTPVGDAAESGGTIVETASPPSTLSTTSPLSPSSLAVGPSAAAVEAAGLGVSETPADAKTAAEPEKNLWEQICEVTNGVKQGCVLAPMLFSMMFSAMLTNSFNEGEHGLKVNYYTDEYEAEQPPFPEGYKVKQQPVITMSSNTKEQAATFEILVLALMVYEFLLLTHGHQIKVSAPLEATVFPGLSAEHFFQVTPNYAIVHDVPCVVPEAPEVFDPKTCSPREYLENFIFPVLLPGMANLLHQAKKEKCFEVRCEPEIQELRQWQKQLREDNHIRERVKEFWAKQEKKVKCTLEDEEEPPNLQPEPSTIIDAPGK